MSPTPSHEQNDGPERSMEIELPSEVWAVVFEYLPYKSILSCAATCRPFLHDAIPLLKTLHIDNSAEMNLAVASRLRDVQSIHVNSLLRRRSPDDEFGKITEVDFETSTRLVAFLVKFPMLENVHFGGKDEEGEILDGFCPANGFFLSSGEEEEVEGDFVGGDSERMLSCIDSLSAAFSIGALPKTLRIYGLCCPKAISVGYRPDTISYCETCLRAAKSFPINSVVAFESRGSSKSKVKSGRGYGVDVCLKYEQIEFVTETRPNGSELLRSNDRLLRMLGNGMAYKVTSDGWNTLYVLRYNQSELEEMSRIIDYAELDVSQIDVKAAIAKYLPPKRSRWYLSEDSFDSLEKELGLPMGNKDLFYGNVTDMVDALPQISVVVNSPDHSNIWTDCFRLLRRLLELEEGSAIQPAIDLGLVPSLVKRLRASYLPSSQTDAARALNSILMRGADDQKSAVMSTKGVVNSLAGCLRSSSEAFAEYVLPSLVMIVSSGTDEHIEALGEYGARLVCVLDSRQKDDITVRDAIKLLATVASKHPTKLKWAIQAKLLPQVLRVMQSPTKAENLANCSILLRTILDVEKQSNQEIIDSGVVPMIAEVMKSEEDSSTQTNLAHVMINLTSGTVEQTQQLLKEEGYVPALASLFECQDKAISHKAILSIGVIANTHPAVVSQLATIETLIRLLQTSKESEVLISLLSTLTQICHVTQADFASARNGVTGFSKLLAHADSELVLCALPALHCLLETFRGEDTDTEAVNAIITVDFVDFFLKLLGNNSLVIQGHAIKAIHLITTLSDSCVESVMQSNGLAIIKDLLASPRGTNEMVHGEACKTLSIMFAGIKSRIQDAINIGLIPIIIDMMSNVLFRVKKEALSVVYEAAKVASTEQLTHIGTPACIGHLFNMLTLDCTDLSFVSLQTLKHMSKAGKVSEADDPEATPPNTQLIEEKLDELIEENSRLEAELERQDLLSKKRVCVLYDRQKLYVESLDDTLELLKEQTLAVQQQLKSFEEKISTKRLLKPLYSDLQRKQSEMKTLLESHTGKLEQDQKVAATKLDEFHDSAQAAAPTKELEERLSKADIPQEIAGCSKAIYASEGVVESIKSTRLSAERKKDIETVKSGLEELFKDNIPGETEEEEGTDVISTTKKRKSSNLVEAAVGDSLDITPKNSKRSKESSMSSKKKVQSGIGRFFGASASKK